MNRIITAAIAAMNRTNMLVLMIACSGAVAAEDMWQPREVNPVWQSECGSCHMAFPPALLSSGDWHLLMQGLEKHFGVDAGLDEKSRDQIATFLERNAGSKWGHSADSLRITETSFFIQKHKGAIRLLIKGRIKSLADCVACHKENGIENPE
jgi:hypothetical protein